MQLTKREFRNKFEILMNINEILSHNIQFMWTGKIFIKECCPQQLQFYSCVVLYDFGQNIMPYRNKQNPGLLSRTLDPRPQNLRQGPGPSDTTPDLDPSACLLTPDHSVGSQTPDSRVEPQTMDPREGPQISDNQTLPQTPDPWTGPQTLVTGSSNMNQDRDHDQ